MARAARRPTIRDVAARAGVAAMTVSYAFNQPSRVSDATRARVLEAASELGYRRGNTTARALRSGTTDQLGVVVGEHLAYAFEDPQAAQFFAGVAEVCVERGLGMVLIPTHGTHERGGRVTDDERPSDVDRVLSAAVDAYVLWTTFEGDAVLDAVASSGRPAAIQGGPAAPGITSVSVDDETAARAVARAAHDAARRAGSTPSAAVISFPLDSARVAALYRGSSLPGPAPYPVTARRLAGFRAAIDETSDDWSSTPIAVVSTNTRSDGREAMRALLASTEGEHELVVLAMSDELALGARDALEERGRTAVLSGWDGTGAASAAGIVSVDNSLREQGRLCARIALGLDDGARPVPWRIAQPSTDPLAGREAAP